MKKMQIMRQKRKMGFGQMTPSLERQAVTERQARAYGRQLTVLHARWGGKQAAREKAPKFFPWSCLDLFKYNTNFILLVELSHEISTRIAK